MDRVAYGLVMLTKYSWIVIALMSLVGAKLISGPSQLRRFGRWLTLFAGIVLAFGLWSESVDVSALAIAKLGKPGSGEVVGTISGQPAKSWADFRVRLRGADGSIYDVTYDDADNRFPLTATTFTLLGIGDRFNVRYMAISPEQFVIVADDNSPWAIRERCYHLALELAQIHQHPEEYDSPASLQQKDRHRYKADNCKAIVVRDWRTSGINDVLEELKK